MLIILRNFNASINKEHNLTPSKGWRNDGQRRILSQNPNKTKITTLDFWKGTKKGERLKYKQELEQGFSEKDEKNDINKKTNQ